MNNYPRIFKTQCYINGLVKNYDGCSSDSLEAAKAFYEDLWEDKCKYIGSSNAFIFDDKISKSDLIYHFFIKEP